MHGTEPRWGVDLQINCEAKRTAYSVNDYADLLVKRMEKAHEVVRGHLSTAACRMCDWYDEKVRTQTFEVGDEVYVLNLLLHKGRSLKWMRRYSHVATVKKRLNHVTYQLHCLEWKRKKFRIIHVDKMKLCRSAAEAAAEEADLE